MGNVKKHLVTCQKIFVAKQLRCLNTDPVSLDETHLDVMRGLIYRRSFAQPEKGKRSSEQSNYVRAEQTDPF